MLELANENSILYTWFGTKYNFTRLCEPYAGSIKGKWNVWLKEKYGNTDNLIKAWTEGLKGDGQEHFPEGRITAASEDYWTLQNDKKSEAFFEVVRSSKKDKLKSKYKLKIDVEKTGAAPHIPQFCGQNIKFRE